MKRTSVLSKEQILRRVRETEAAQSILALFYLSPLHEYALSELAKQAKVAKSTAFRIVNQLRDRELVTIAKIGLVWRIQANYQNPQFRRKKLLEYNLPFIFHSGLIEWLEQAYHHPKAIILFGSFRTGEDALGSDVDIALEVDRPEEKGIERRSELEQLESSLGRNIQIHRFHRSTVDRNVFTNIANGIVLSGLLEARP